MVKIKYEWNQGQRRLQTITWTHWHQHASDEHHIRQPTSILSRSLEPLLCMAELWMQRHFVDWHHCEWVLCSDSWNSHHVWAKVRSSGMVEWNEHPLGKSRKERQLVLWGCAAVKACHSKIQEVCQDEKLHKGQLRPFWKFERILVGRDARKKEHFNSGIPPATELQKKVLS